MKWFLVKPVWWDLRSELEKSLNHVRAILSVNFGRQGKIGDGPVIG